jgi:preprotein translocase subunit YajC
MLKNHYANHGFEVGQLRVHKSGIYGTVISISDTNIPIITVKSFAGTDRFIPRSVAASEWRLPTSN